MQPVVSNGILKQIFDADEVPGFAINKKEIGSRSGLVEHFKENEFLLQHITFIKNDNQVRISWDAAALEKNNIQINILKSSNNHEFVKVNSNVISTEQINAYSFSESYTAASKYKIEVVKNKSTVRYTSEEFNTNRVEQYVLYPSPATNTLNLDATVENQIIPSGYEIISTAGVSVQWGELNKSKNELDISNLPAGAYFIRTANSTLQFIKL